ncbi:MAG: hypothetical protein PQJ59_03245 [Spirochaetales bacterium]|nr:hypothetical protein [Spirochaetales bacterium]
MILDTHAAVFLHAGRLEEFSELGKRLLEKETIYIGPMALLELQYLYEIKRIKYTADQIRDDLLVDIGLEILQRDWFAVTRKAWELDWTRDPFDRIITAQALVEGERLLTRDRTILENCSLALW